MSDVQVEGRAELAAALGDGAMAVALDVTDPDQWDGAVRATVDVFGGLDVLVNNAGIGIPPRVIEDVDLADHHRTMAVNLDGVLPRDACGRPGDAGRGRWLDRQHLVDRRDRRRRGDDQLRGEQVRASPASPAAPHSSWVGTAIRVNSIHPGVIASPMVEQRAPDVRARLDRLMAQQPIPRMGTPEEVASLALFLASDESSYCTGAQFVIDGGHLAGPYREGLWD